MFIRYKVSDTGGIYCHPHNTMVLTKPNLFVCCFEETPSVRGFFFNISKKIHIV